MSGPFADSQLAAFVAQPGPAFADLEVPAMRAGIAQRAQSRTPGPAMDLVVDLPVGHRPARLYRPTSTALPVRPRQWAICTPPTRPPDRSAVDAFPRGVQMPVAAVVAALAGALLRSGPAVAKLDRLDRSMPDAPSRSRYGYVRAMDDVDRTEGTLTARELEQIASFLHDNRVEVLSLLDGLTQEQARRRLVASATTLLGLVKHAAFVERVWFDVALAGRSRAELGLPDTAEESFILREQILAADR